ncbi:MAG: DNA cytosine methyltransferase [Chitinophagaceae bacterium]|nr:DNA cytosine methyltransferase [Nitrosomonas sp.]MCW5929903.1 DNA cytosine methyltransferase [Chitinophagaceae bacterium]
MKNNIKAYYNEWDKDAAEWLRQLIKDGLITDGVVDERSITEVIASDIRGFDRVHWFAGIGTWDYCLTQAGWGDRPVWTASLPCQSFSVAGKQLGKADERHLLPQFLEFVKECRPDTIFGEQVNKAIQHGWLDDLHAEMEAEDYAVGHCVFGAHSIGAAHIRQRLYWVAHHISKGLEKQPGVTRFPRKKNVNDEGENSSRSGWMGYANSETGERETGRFLEKKDELNIKRIKDGVVCERYSDASEIDWMGIPHGYGREQGSETSKAARYRNTVDAASGVDWLYCRDGKYRPVKSGTTALVNGFSRRMVRGSDKSEEEIKPNETAEAHAMRLKGYGNAIVAGCAIEFIKTYMEYKNK